MREVWRPVKGYEGRYDVSDKGEIRSYYRAKSIGRILLQRNEGHGYKQVALYNNGKRTEKRVHVLVAEAFLGEAPVGSEVNHKNGDKADNRAENLEWSTHSWNMEHAFEMGLHAHPRRRCVCGDGREFSSIAEAARETGADRTKITACCRGRIKSTCGLTWRYAEEGPA